MTRCLEVCVGSVAGAVAARNGGAVRVELCSALEVGGITPSIGLVREVRKIEGLALHVLIRPRGGDFCYDEGEVSAMEQDIIALRQCGVDGVVIGALTPDGDVDVEVCRRLVTAAGALHVTFHRAFDVCRYPLRALEDIIDLGCDRLLTSGQHVTAELGVPLLRQLVDAVAGRLTIMPGCGVKSTNAATILDASGAVEIHASARKQVESVMRFRHEGVNMGTPGSDEYLRLDTDVEEVRRIVNAINKE